MRLLPRLAFPPVLLLWLTFVMLCAIAIFQITCPPYRYKGLAQVTLAQYWKIDKDSRDIVIIRNLDNQGKDTGEVKIDDSSKLIVAVDFTAESDNPFGRTHYPYLSSVETRASRFAPFTVALIILAAVVGAMAIFIDMVVRRTG